MNLISAIAKNFIRGRRFKDCNWDEEMKFQNKFGGSALNLFQLIYVLDESGGAKVGCCK